jgi:PAS domain S-box-containing protein
MTTKEDVRIELLENVKYLEQSRLATLNILEDLQEEKEALAKAKAEDESILASIGDGLVVVDKDMKVTLVNHATEMAIGWSRQEMLGKIWADLVELETENGKKVLNKNRPLFLAVHAEKTTTTTTTTFSYTRKNKTKFPVAITVSLIILKGEVIGAVEVFRDITKEQEIDKAKTEFVSLASHQLRTPLTAINWYVEMLQSGDAGKLNLKQKKYLEEIYQDSGRMVKLVNDLLNISRIETGRLKIEPELVDLALLITDIIHEIEPWSTGLHREIVFKTSKIPLPMIPVDKTLMRQVIHNIITNAVRYSPESKNPINVSLEKKTGEYLIGVSDDGIGIPKEVQGKIFEKFFRADNARGVEGGGSGIGMYISKSIVEASGGKIWFKSPTLFKKVEDKEVGYGTTFYLSIPISGMKEHDGEKSLS